MKPTLSGKLKDGDQCKVVGGTHAGKSGTVRDINTSKTGHITITVEQKNGPLKTKFLFGVGCAYVVAFANF
ncbi:MAG: KOW motif-containing protein [Saprospiraceae bacterium]|uniref:KOW motif-containing protein n=1 Tax=Candidatus Opimibacter skivensis TaxID=2982028 RepID=A0A9D7SSJ1_9BACT|nr:KOW motif-containing protein [Candidatus Opimibacter skivensis]